MSFKHGIYISEVPTSIVPPVKSENSMPVAFVTAPVHLAEDPYSVTNVPKLCYTYAEAVSYFGFHLKSDIWNTYTAPQVIYSQFVLYGVAPITIINVLDPKKHKEAVKDKTVAIEDDAAVLEVDGVLIDTVKVVCASKELVAGEDYSLAFNDDGHVVVNVLTALDTANELLLSYDALRPDMVDIYDIIGGYNISTGKNKGLELIDDIFMLFRIVPGQIIAPKYSMDPSVASIMETKAGNINGLFRCTVHNDMPTKNDDENLIYTDVPAWKNKNNYVSTRQNNLYPKLLNGEQEFYYSTQMAGLICKTDANNGGIPYESPSNNNMKINGICFEGGEELTLNIEQANYLNSQGIITAINFVNGWVAWGNRTGAYPGNTDVKDSIISNRRMFDYVGNQLILTYWSKVDGPMTKRRIYTIVNSVNMWLNTMTAAEYILGGKIQFLEEDNSTIDLIDGSVKFRIGLGTAPPMEDVTNILEYDTDYIEALFA